MSASYGAHVGCLCTLWSCPPPTGWPRTRHNHLAMRTSHNMGRRSLSSDCYFALFLPPHETTQHPLTAWTTRAHGHQRHLPWFPYIPWCWQVGLYMNAHDPSQNHESQGLWFWHGISSVCIFCIKIVPCDFIVVAPSWVRWMNILNLLTIRPER